MKANFNVFAYLTEAQQQLKPGKSAQVRSHSNLVPKGALANHLSDLTKP
jgi:hypothetical protein